MRSLIITAILLLLIALAYLSGRYQAQAEAQRALEIERLEARMNALKSRAEIQRFVTATYAEPQKRNLIFEIQFRQ